MPLKGGAWPRPSAATNGMFALAVWDVRERSLQLARDRLGEKPLYYGFHRGRWLFASELKALRAHPEFTTNNRSRRCCCIYA